jgi:hypothetical protein
MPYTDHCPLLSRNIASLVYRAPPLCVLVYAKIDGYRPV